MLKTLLPDRPLLLAICFWIVFLLLLICFGTIGSGMLPPAYARAGYGVLGSLATLATALLFLGPGWLRESGLLPGRRTVIRLALGFLLGLLTMAILIAFVCFCSGVRLKPTGGSVAGFNAWPLLAFLPLALMEEIAFRGWTFRMLTQRKGLRTAQWATALAFGVYHIANGWHPLAALTGPFAWSFLFGWAAYRSGGLALPTGFHAALNVGQSLVGLGAGVQQSLWQLTLPGSSSEEAAARTTPAGIAAQVLVLATGIYLTERHMRRNKNNPGNAAIQPVRVKTRVDIADHTA